MHAVWTRLSQVYERDKDETSNGSCSEEKKLLTKSKSNPCECEEEKDVQSFIKNFRELQAQKEGIQIQLHNEVMQWKSKARRGVCTHETRKLIHNLIEQFKLVHEEQDGLLESERERIDSQLAGRSAGIEEEQEDPNNATLHAQIACFRRFNEQHVNLIVLVLQDIQECRSIIDIADGNE